MVVGTTSHAGKSFLTAALCRILARKGWQVSPFKGQNMSLNAYVTATGREMGYAQAVQAWAAGTAPRVEMNPILLKPQGNMTSQVVVMGKVVGVTTASDYYKQYFDRGWQAIASALKALEQEYDVVVCEGAGSPAEINLKHRDLTNMRVAKHLGAATVLVVDIDRGGAFAHVVGTLALLEPDERELIKGIVINKFRGQKSLLDSGIQWLEAHTGIPVLGVIPWSETFFPAEDSLDLLEPRRPSGDRDLTIKVLRLPRIANFTDFDPLKAEPTLHLDYLDLKGDLEHPDALIIPGSKTTISDLAALHESGMAQKIRDYHAAGGIVFGICGGYQMLGQQVFDPDRLEGNTDSCPGLGLLAVKTRIVADKIVRQRQAISCMPQAGLLVTGYEIHNGITQTDSPQTSAAHTPLFDDPSLGILNAPQSVWGTYLHGLFDNGAWRRVWINTLRKRRGLPSLPTGIGNYREQRETILDDLTNWVVPCLNLTPLLGSLK